MSHFATLNTQAQAEETTMHGHPPSPTSHLARKLPCIAIACALLCLGTQALAQTDSGPAAVWRATSRLGYAPSPASAQAAQAGPKAWALQQIDGAYAASQKSANVPAELAAFNAPVDDLARDFHAYNEARKKLRERTTNAPDSDADKAVVEERFLREIVRSAAAWRVMACSDGALEHPLLAKMTEFWFNHFNVSIT